MTQQAHKKHNRLELRTHVTCALVLLLILLMSACGDDSNQTQQTVSEYGETSVPQIEVDETPTAEDIWQLSRSLVWSLFTTTVASFFEILLGLACSLAGWRVSLLSGVVLFLVVLYNRGKSGYYGTFGYEVRVAFITAILGSIFVLFISFLCWVFG